MLAQGFEGQSDSGQPHSSCEHTCTHLVVPWITRSVRTSIHQCDFVVTRSAKQYSVLLRLLATYQLGLASARLSQEDQAHRLALDLITWDRVDTQPWLQQTALLYAADILSAVDRLADARDTSWRALMMGNGLALSRKFAGLAARLLALNLTHPQRARAASEAIERISAESCPMDVIDEVEVLDAQIRAARAVGTSDVQLVARMTTCAAALPPRLNIYFKDMGVVI